MDWDLEADELRVLGCLMEKERTTPDQYPLSVNAIVNACNQKSARDPVMSLNEGDVRAALGSLTRRGLVRMASGYGGRVSKYQHRLGDSTNAAVRVSPEQFALLCVLILRGPQTPGELRSRSQRLFEFPDTAAVEAALESLEQHDTGRLVECLPREPGKRESRYAHRLGTGEPAPRPEWDEEVVREPVAPTREDPLEARVRALEKEVERLVAVVESLGKSSD